MANFYHNTVAIYYTESKHCTLLVQCMCVTTCKMNSFRMLITVFNFSIPLYMLFHWKSYINKSISNTMNYLSVISDAAKWILCFSFFSINLSLYIGCVPLILLVLASMNEQYRKFSFECIWISFLFTIYNLLKHSDDKLAQVNLLTNYLYYSCLCQITNHISPTTCVVGNKQGTLIAIEIIAISAILC